MGQQRRAIAPIPKNEPPFGDLKSPSFPLSDFKYSGTLRPLLLG
jgi:hypothetical protein